MTHTRQSAISHSRNSEKWVQSFNRSDRVHRTESRAYPADTRMESRLMTETIAALALIVRQQRQMLGELASIRGAIADMTALAEHIEAKVSGLLSDINAAPSPSE